MENLDIFTLSEPLDKWKNIHNSNLLDLMYEQPEQWATPFQSYAMLTMLQNIYSTRYIFMEAHRKEKNINEINW